jgi:solute carrier family 50 protein (sugar transporter)
MTVSWTDVVLQYVCPVMGSILANTMFAAPVRDLRKALVRGSLGVLNPFPWAVGAGNCLGWVVYGYYTRDPFMVAANLPSLILHVWLNSGAAKLQYLEQNEAVKRNQRSREEWDAAAEQASYSYDEEEFHEVSGSVGDHDSDQEVLVMVPQEQALMRILTAWAVVVVYVGWFYSRDPATIVGLVVNANLVFFYGAPLQTVRTVVTTSDASTIHTPTMIMNCLNTSFWVGYGIARRDPVIIIPNAAGFTLGLGQGVLKLLYPSNASDGISHSPVPSDLPPEEDLPMTMTGGADSSLSHRNPRTMT